MKLKTSLILLAVAFIWTSCSGPIKLQDSWTAPNIKAKKFNKIGLVMISKDEPTKDKVESYMSDEMRAKGYPAIPTFTLFPFAGNKEVEEGMNMSAEEHQVYIKERINKFNFDALIVMSVLGVDENLKSKPSVGVGISAPVTYYDANYTQYWSYANMYVSSPSYYIAKDYYLEATLFDVESEEMHWTAQFDISNPSSLNKTATQFADRIIEILIKEGVMEK